MREPHRCWGDLVHFVSPCPFSLPSPRPAHRQRLLFLSQICKGTSQHEEICLGLFTLVLTEPAQAQKVRHAPAASFFPRGFCFPGSPGCAEVLLGKFLVSCRHQQAPGCGPQR